MIKVVIVDDEEPSLQMMKIMINKNSNLNIVGEYLSSKYALKNISIDNPDVVFLDVEMPIMNGIELAEKIQEYNKNIQIVFISAYPQYAINAFTVNAVNYVLKPITEKQINITTERLLKSYNLIKDIKKENSRYIIECFGSFKIYEESSEICVKWNTSKVEQLFAYFICHRGEWHDKWKLCDILWCDATVKNAEHNLHSTIYRLKNALKNIGIQNIIDYNQGIYRMNLTNFYCDMWSFEDFVFADKLIDSCNINEYEKMISLYKGQLFGGKDYIWAIDFQERFNDYYVNLVKNVIKYYIYNKEYTRAELHAKNLLKLNPFDNEVNELIMSIYVYVDDNMKLIKHYDQVCNLFKEELGVEFKISKIGKLYKKLILEKEKTEM